MWLIEVRTRREKSVFSWGQRSHIFFTRSGGGASFVSCIYDSIVRTSCGLCNWMWLTMCSWFVFGQWKTVRMYLMPLRWFCSIFFLLDLLFHVVHPIFSVKRFLHCVFVFINAFTYKIFWHIPTGFPWETFHWTGIQTSTVFLLPSEVGITLTATFTLDWADFIPLIKRYEIVIINWDTSTLIQA